MRQKTRIIHVNFLKINESLEGRVPKGENFQIERFGSAPITRTSDVGFDVQTASLLSENCCIIYTELVFQQ